MLSCTIFFLEPAIASVIVFMMISIPVIFFRRYKTIENNWVSLDFVSALRAGSSILCAHYGFPMRLYGEST